MPIIDFISRAKEIPNLRMAVLYGSVVKDEFHKKSDIDLLLLFDCTGNPEVTEEGKTAHKISSEILSGYNIPHSFSFVMENINDTHLDTKFLRNVVNEGVVIWALPEVVMLEGVEQHLEPATVFSYALSHLSPRDKMAVHRALYGYSVEKTVKGKKYHNESDEGLIGEYGEKLGDGVIMVPSRFAKDVLSIFKSHNVEYTVKEVWT
jgi:hypothetical protein